MTTVGLEDHRHEVGSCHTTFVLPGRTAPQACGDPRCEAVARDQGTLRANTPEELMAQLRAVPEDNPLHGLCRTAATCLSMALESGRRLRERAERGPLLFARAGEGRVLVTPAGKRKLKELGLWWTDEDQVAAQAQGWDVFEHPSPDGSPYGAHFEINHLEQPGDFAYSKVRDDEALVEALVARSSQDELALMNTGSPYFRVADSGEQR
jgi:hypothetical protein